MARLPTFQRILPEDFPELEWLPRFAEPLNRFMEEVTAALNQQLRVSENMDGIVKVVQIDGTYPKKFQWPLKIRPVAAWVGQCREIDENHTTRSTAVDLDWEFTADGQFQINAVPGLTAALDDKFNLTIIAITG